MNRERDRPRPKSPQSWRLDPKRKGQVPESNQAQKLDPETSVGEGVAVDAALERESQRLQAEIERLRDVEAGFEKKHHTSLDEFQAHYRPGEDTQADEDYLQWAHVAEQLRQAQARLMQLGQRGQRVSRSQVQCAQCGHMVPLVGRHGKQPPGGRLMTQWCPYCRRVTQHREEPE